MRKPLAGIFLLLSIAGAASAQSYTAGGAANGYSPANQYGYYPGNYYGYSGYGYPQSYGYGQNRYNNPLPASPSVPMVYAPPFTPQGPPPAPPEGAPSDGTAASDNPAPPTSPSPAGLAGHPNIRDPYDDYFRPHCDRTWFSRGLCLRAHEVV